MFRQTRSRQRSAATSCNRIELAPSRRAAIAAAVWLGIAVELTYRSALPVWMRLLIAAGVLLAGGFSIWRHVLLEGSRALRALEWDGQENYFVEVGSTRRRLSAVPEGVRRYGPHLWILGFRTAEGRVGAVLDAGCQEARAVRSLARHLSGVSGRSAGGVPAAGRRQAATIRPKV